MSALRAAANEAVEPPALGERYVVALDDGTVGIVRRHQDAAQQHNQSRPGDLRTKRAGAVIDAELVKCQLCGRHWRSLGHHVRHGHGISADEYRDRFGIRRGTPLTSPATRARLSASISRTIADGKLDEHYAGNADRAGIAALAGRAEKRAMRERGIDLPHGTAPHERDMIVAVVAAVEAGTKVATAVKWAGISYSSYHVGLARHPDLKARHEAARGSRG